MNTSSRSLVDRLMIKILHRNKNNNDIDDVEALAYLNEATREVFRWFSLYIPTHVRTRYTYELTAGENEIKLPSPAVVVHRVKVGTKEFTRSGPMVPFGKKETYIHSGFNIIELEKYVVNNGDILTVDYISAEVMELVIPTPSMPLQDGQTDRSVFPQMWDDPIIEHAMISYEAARGMLQDSETARKSQWTQQLMAVFSEQIPTTSVGEYYQSYAPRGDML